jgi:predicted transcriptional regulator
MAIHPRYADAILDGNKQVEFRKRRLASDITTVLIYATSPVQRIVGEFRIREMVVGAPDAIWDAFGDVGIIDRDSFGDYYASSEHAVAIVVDVAKRYERSQPLSELTPAPAIPQSFSYIARGASRRGTSRRVVANRS